ncbi:MAG: DUF2203 domain-containing protein [Solirubrobacteraceae bacterium]
MLHERHYTLEQARASMDWVAERVHRIRAARGELAGLTPDARRALVELDGRTGGAYPGRAIARPIVALSHAVAELQAVEIVVRDADRGLVDFPALRDGVEVYLCWLVDDEREIGFWHEPGAGFAGRRAL